MYKWDEEKKTTTTGFTEETKVSTVTNCANEVYDAIVAIMDAADFSIMDKVSLST